MKSHIALVGALVLGLGAPQFAEAQPNGRARGQFDDSLGSGWRQQQDQAREGVRQGRLLPLPMIIAQISRRYPGRALDAGLETFAGRSVYRVRWATQDGRRIDFIVDAMTGQVLSGG